MFDKDFINRLVAFSVPLLVIVDDIAVMFSFAVRIEPGSNIKVLESSVKLTLFNVRSESVNVSVDDMNRFNIVFIVRLAPSTVSFADVIDKFVVVMLVLLIVTFAELVIFMLANVITSPIVVFAPELSLLSIIKLPYVCASAFKKIVPAPPC